MSIKQKVANDREILAKIQAALDRGAEEALLSLWTLVRAEAEKFGFNPEALSSESPTIQYSLSRWAVYDIYPVIYISETVYSGHYGDFDKMIEHDKCTFDNDGAVLQLEEYHLYEDLGVMLHASLRFFGNFSDEAEITLRSIGKLIDETSTYTSTHKSLRCES